MQGGQLFPQQGVAVTTAKLDILKHQPGLFIIPALGYHSGHAQGFCPGQLREPLGLSIEHVGQIGSIQFDEIALPAAFQKQRLVDIGIVTPERAKALGFTGPLLRDGQAASIETSAIHMDIMRDLKQINSHLASVAYPILHSSGELLDSRLKTFDAELDRLERLTAQREHPATRGPGVGAPVRSVLGHIIHSDTIGRVLAIRASSDREFSVSNRYTTKCPHISHQAESWTQL